MNRTIFPEISEINYRKKQYKYIQDVLDSTICCAICNSDLKQNIILNSDIMLHKTFLCLCCKNCFDKLSDSQNRCIFCSMDTELKTCEICTHNMCKRCIDNFYSDVTHLRKKNKCLGCSSSVLWELRSQANAVLKCFSLELETRLVLNGEESEQKQNLLEFIRYDAKCNENFTEKDIYQIRIDYLCDSLKSKIIPLIHEHEELKTKTIEEKKNHFIKLCELILVNTSSVLLNFKSFFNKENIESLNNNVQSIMRNGNLFKTAKIKEHSTNISQNIFNVSLDEENKQQDFFISLSNEAISKNTTDQIVSFKDRVCWNPVIKLQRFDMKEYSKRVDVEPNSKRRKLNNETVTPNMKNTANNVCLNPRIRLNKYDAKKCTNRVDVELKSKKIKSSNTATKHKIKDIADYVFCNPEIPLQRYCMKKYKSHVNVPKSTKSKCSETIQSNMKNTADKIISLNCNTCLNPEIQLYKFDMKEDYNNRVDDELKSEKIKLSNEAISKNTTDQIVSFKDRVCWNPVIKLQRFDMKECSKRIDVGPNSKRKKEEKRTTRKMFRKRKVNNK